MTIISRPFDSDPEAGITRIFHYDDVDDSTTIETIADVTALTEANKDLANMEEHNRFADMRRVASIPLSVLHDLKKRGIVDDPKRFKAWLNDNENRFFRTNWERV